MLQNRQNFRKCVASKGLVFIDGQELEIVVRNLSITGLLAELEANDKITNIRDVFKAVKSNSIVDIYLQEMHLAGEAEVVRADLDEGRIYIALEFRNMSYGVDHLLYKRKAYRKSIQVPGYIVFNKKVLRFGTQNISVDGLMIRIPETVRASEGEVTDFEFLNLELKGQVKVIWVEYGEDGSTLMGLRYVQMIRETFKGIPRFVF